MSLPFSVEQFLGVFASYNEAVWPTQIVLNLLGVACVTMLALGPSLGSRFIAAALAFLLVWSGLVYHAMFFSAVSALGGLFAALFLIGAALFVWQGVVRERLEFGMPPATLRAAVGFALVGYALVAYPLLALWFGHRYPAMPTFGAPCPVILFTIGMLAFLRPPYPRQVLVVPLVWIVIASQATFSFGMYEDLGLLPAGAAGLWFALQPFTRARHA